MIIAGAAEIPLKKAAAKIHVPPGITRGETAEIRLRAGRSSVLVTVSGRMVICSKPLTRSDIEECFEELCGYSVHSYSREISEGYITLAGGHRVGFCGTAVMRGGELETLRDISSLNIRIAHEVKGCAGELYSRVFGSGLCSLLLGGRPLSGKTTVLRDLSRLLGAEHRVALIDSRNELSATYHGMPTLDVGLNTDVLCGYEKSDGIMCALRSLSPEVIICDEIGDDAASLEQCMRCGVKIIASAHTDSMAQMLAAPRLAGICAAMDCAAVLGASGRISDVKWLKGNII